MTKGYGRAWFTAQGFICLAADDFIFVSIPRIRRSCFSLNHIHFTNRLLCLSSRSCVGFRRADLTGPSLHFCLSAKFTSRRSGRVLLHNRPLRNLDGCPTAGCNGCLTLPCDISCHSSPRLVDSFTPHFTSPLRSPFHVNAPLSLYTYASAPDRCQVCGKSCKGCLCTVMLSCWRKMRLDSFLDHSLLLCFCSTLESLIFPRLHHL